MACVPEHDGEEEGEGDDGEDGGIHLPVCRHTVGVNQLLEGVGELICPEEGRRRLGGLHLVEDRGNGAARALGAAPQGQLDGLQVEPWDPALGDQTLLAGVQVEEVERVVDGLDLADLHEPNLNETDESQPKKNKYFTFT